MPRLTTRDYKRAAPRRSSAGQLAAFAVGVIVGAALTSGGFMLHRARARHAAMPPPSPARSALGTPARPAAPPGAAAAARAPAGDPSTTAGAATPAHQQYDFYSMLPRFTVRVPQAPAKAPRTPAAEPGGAAHAASGSAQASYVLQVGSYRRSTEAQAVRARLARAGIDARVERVLAGGGVWYRVRIGPISDPTELERVRTQLRAARLSALEMRID
jgi:cell division protein FtsN